MSTLRFKVVEEAYGRKAVPVAIPSERPSEYYGKYVFNRAQMYKYLDKDTYDALVYAIDNKEPLSRRLADRVAAGMKQWAMDNGARHYSHWFHPLTDGTAEKHDGFIEHDGKGGVVEEFSGKLLVQQEPDASSFPNGGIRNTFEARGYSAWDISSPAFIIDHTLCIPTIFISYTGESLDYKTPLLRALNSVDKAGAAVARYFDENVQKVFCYLGWEQEYFLVDESLWAVRPDLMLTGRTLMGHESAKNQQLEDHYFGAIPSRVMSFMKDLEYECLKLGIPVKTRHNEVAPNQFELAPVYEETNLANDHNLLLMSLMTEVAHRHNFEVLLHEKPFAGVNGSGKHNNWSLGTDTGAMLFSPGKTPKDNLQFITFLANVMAAVQRHNGLLKASIASATNEHRLGANEAPPAIISMFLGAQITDVIDRLLDTDVDDDIAFSAKEGMKLKNVSQIPELLVDNTDRNRTSPFAFTGNRFEFRALGSSANCASAMIALNAAVADQLTKFKEAVDARIATGEIKERAILEEAKKLFRENKAIHFDGNGYSDEWVVEAKRRGLCNMGNTVDALPAYINEKNVAMFSRHGVLTRDELEARYNIHLENYCKVMTIEGNTLLDMTRRQILPAVSKYSDELATALFHKKNCGISLSAKMEENTLRKLADLSGKLYDTCDALERAISKAPAMDGGIKAACYYRDEVDARRQKASALINQLETITSAQHWPFPSYADILFSV